MMNRFYGLVMCTTLLAGVLSQVFVPFADANIYFLECGILTAWLISDAIERRAPLGTAVSSAVASLVLAPLMVPRWYANRPLKPGEFRSGGADANFFNAFGIIALLFTGVSAACNFLSFGPDHGFELIVNAGFAVAGTGLVLGLVAKRERVLEKGAASIAKLPKLPKNAESETE